MNGLRHACLGMILFSALAAATPSTPTGPTVGRTAPPITAARWYNTSKPLALEQLHGRVVLLDFWGLWCTPCHKQLPDLVRLQRRYGPRGLVIVMVHTPQKAGELPEYLRKERIPLVIAVDTGETARAYGVTAYPTYVLIDSHGRVASFPDDPPEPREVEPLLGSASRR